ncbi:hypothetical protein NDI76_18925 [Halogeometricum sp. S1BR25-6]|uniref:Uncharacterized protein n=1 Tax=Halogeometricum salsisoli TaxID=2950536 RepID=A0ABU2GJ25_9EURY|nr:hypothetical protein [Halogeometricum sp. S1BR25-6]MDS0300826.1 hypothetical protein [Halogeometricum sp. S1BR25-6]
MRYHRSAVLVGLVVLALAGSILLGAPGSEETVLPRENQLIQPEDTGTQVWPYTSRSRSVTGRTLALNVLIVGDPDRTKRALTNRAETNWTTVEGDEATAGESEWQPARGASRYTYVTVDPNITGRWFESEYQLATGTYLGQRVHIRAYPAPSGNWTAFQAHTEYWDWLRLRHTVTGVAPGARFLERDLRDEPFVERISREYHGLGGGGSDGWITIIELVSAAGAAGAAASIVPLGDRHRDVADAAVLPVTLAGLVLGVRSAGIALEHAIPGVTPKLFAAVLYPVVVAGPPFLVTIFARDRPATRSALLAAAGLGAGVVLDLGAVGATTVSVQFVLHRVALVSALGLFAVGVARQDRRTISAGAVAWLVALGLPLFGIV